MVPHSSTLAWKILWTEEPGRLPSMGSRRVGHDWATSLSLFTFTHWRRKWQPTPVSLPGESRDGGAWWAGIYGVTQSQTQLKWRSSSSMTRLCTFCGRHIYMNVILPSVYLFLAIFHLSYSFVGKTNKNPNKLTFRKIWTVNGLYWHGFSYFKKALNCLQKFLNSVLCAPIGKMISCCVIHQGRGWNSSLL